MDHIIVRTYWYLFCGGAVSVLKTVRLFIGPAYTIGSITRIGECSACVYVLVPFLRRGSFHAEDRTLLYWP